MLGIAIAGCTPATNLSQPAPTQVHIAKSPTQTAQAIAASLVQQGFTLSVADAAGGIVQAQREWKVYVDTSVVHCRWKSIKQAINTTMLVTATASPDSGGSALTIRTAVKTHWSVYEALAKELDNNETDCASNGAVERSLVEAASK